jgi:D-alanine-D-alanine ligase
MKTIALFFGGLSNEAAVSVMSARNVAKYFDRRRYKLILIYWQRKDGRFYRVKDVAKPQTSVKNRVAIEDFSRLFDIALLMTHGRYGEDGVLQAILESQKIKYCGCGVLASALCMDKAVFKDLISATKISQTKYAVFDFQNRPSKELAALKYEVLHTFRFPLYIKPANSGSSVGITRVVRPSQLGAAFKEALRHDSKLVVEEGLTNPKEIEVAVLGNRELLVSRPGELRLVKDFYDYDDKYKLGQAAAVVPAKIPAAAAQRIRELAAQAYRLSGCRGFARVDFFLDKGKIYLNEINTLPGFTDISMYPMLMMDRNMTYTELLNRIIELGGE